MSLEYPMQQMEKELLLARRWGARSLKELHAATTAELTAAEARAVKAEKALAAALPRLAEAESRARTAKRDHARALRRLEAEQVATRTARKAARQAERRATRLAGQLDAMRASLSWRVGRKVTAVPRALRRNGQG